jgi:molybdate transport system substrate-binding protein
MASRRPSPTGSRTPSSSCRQGRRARRRPVAILAVAVAVLALASCSGDDRARSGSPTGTITVFAAASLTDAFAAVAEAFEATDQGVAVQLSFAGSSSLREQILAGAPADVFASADQANVDRLVDAGELDPPTAFATNRLQIVVPAGNPGGVRDLDDFADTRLLIGLCAEAVPCGGLARQALDAAGVTPAPDTEEPDVRALLTKVEAAELDAGIVYLTDVLAAGDRVEGIDVPADLGVVATYSIGTVASSGNRQAAEAFVEFVRSEQGQALLHRFGFGRP